MDIPGVSSHHRLDFKLLEKMQSQDFTPSREIFFSRGEKKIPYFDGSATAQTEGCWHVSVNSFLLNILRTLITGTDTIRAA